MSRRTRIILHPRSCSRKMRNRSRKNLQKCVNSIRPGRCLRNVFQVEMHQSSPSTKKYCKTQKRSLSQIIARKRWLKKNKRPSSMMSLFPSMMQAKSLKKKGAVNQKYSCLIYSRPSLKSKSIKVTQTS